MIRLNGDLRAALKKSVREIAFKKELDKWLVDARKLALEGYNIHLPKEDQDRLKAIPQQHLISKTVKMKLKLTKMNSTDDAIYLGIVEYDYNGSRYANLQPISMHDPLYISGNDFSVVNTALYHKVEKHLAKQDELHKKRADVIVYVSQLIDRSVSVEAMVAEWPEGPKLLPKLKELIDGNIKAVLPVVRPPSALLTEALA